ncbi:hypothetical protein ACIQU4_32980 [Streptomyces sp. NPDC090741]|uniref:hypothetical protein n=1 Tax=Streptomyces sp. NPDC090741 TaxID=3365967 RepID=UPI003817A720
MRDQAVRLTDRPRRCRPGGLRRDANRADGRGPDRSRRACRRQRGGLGANALPQITGTVTLLSRNTTTRRDPDASEAFRIAEIDGPNGRLTVDGVTATGGGCLEYAGTYLPTDGATLVLRHSAVTNSTANYGGAIFVDQGSTLEVHDSGLRNSAALQGGAVYNGPRSTTLLKRTRVDNTPNKCRPVGSVPACTS